MDTATTTSTTRRRTARPGDGPPPDPEVAGRDRGTEETRGETQLYVYSFSKLDPELRASIVGDLSPPEETTEEKAARLEWCRAATAEYDAEFGPLTAEEKAWADAILDELGIGVEDR